MDAELERKLRLHGQEHLILSHKKAPSPAFIRDINTIDFDEVTASYAAAANNNNDDRKVGEAGSGSASMVPIDPSYCEGVSEADPAKLERYFNLTLEAVSRGEVGLVCLAGGMGTRLGVDYPKGMYDIELPSRKSLYQVQLEKTQRVVTMAKESTGRDCAVPVFVMTSEHTKDSTEAFFKEHNHFGMDPKDVVLFEQRMIPCLDNAGKVIRESRDKVARSPDGNGGLYWALHNEGVLEAMAKRGVKYVHVYCVDNVLVKVADPLFLGYCIDKGAEAGNKVVEKAFPDEAVGVVCKVNDRIQVVEYSEIPKDVSERREDNGKLAFRAANICNHFFTTEFLQRVCREHLKELPQHMAHKKIPFYDADSDATEKPTSNNGVKLEKFVFDVFEFARDGKFVVWECLREDEFSPLKNADGPGKADTPTTAREALYALHKKYVEKAGGEVAVPGGGGVPVVEISPLLSYAEENLGQLVKGRKLEAPVQLG